MFCRDKNSIPFSVACIGDSSKLHRCRNCWCCISNNKSIRCQGDKVECYGIDNGCCTDSCPCMMTDGDCDDNTHCVGGLTCGTDNCDTYKYIWRYDADKRMKGGWSSISQFQKQAKQWSLLKVIEQRIYISSQLSRALTVQTTAANERTEGRTEEIGRRRLQWLSVSIFFYTYCSNRFT